MPGFGFDIFRYNPLMGGVSVDPDAQAFITAASITDPTQQSAVNQLVLDLKAASIWTKMKAVYPFVGGSSTAHQYNLINPATYQISFSGGWTHSVNGIEGNAVNSVANTGLNVNTVMDINSSHYSVYIISNITNDGYVDIGAFSGGSAVVDMYSRFSSGNMLGRAFDTTFASGTVANSQKLRVISRSASNLTKIYNNGSSIGQTTNASVSKPNANIYIGSLNNAGSAVNVSARQYAFASIGDGLSDAEVTALNNAVVTFQTTLSRNV